MENAYVVYLNKSYDVWSQDAHKWAAMNGILAIEIISETAFWVYLNKGLLNGVPVYFVKDILIEH